MTKSVNKNFSSKQTQSIKFVKPSKPLEFLFQLFSCVGRSHKFTKTPKEKANEE